MKLIKRFFKRGKYFIAVILILLAFLLSAFSVSANSSLIYDSYTRSQAAEIENSFFTSAPVPVEFLVEGYEYDSTYEYSLHYGLAASLEPICYLNETTVSNSTIVNDSLPYSFFWSGTTFPVSSSLELFNYFSNSDTDFKFIGTTHFTNSDFIFSNPRSSTGVTPTFSAYVDDIRLSLRDFYLWNGFYDNRIDTSSEVSLIFDYSDQFLRVDYIDFYYSFAGESTINKLTIDAFDDENLIDIYNGEYILSPSFLGIEDPGSLVYVHQCDFHFNTPFGDSGQVLLVQTYLNFDVIYTFNPYLDNVIDPYPPQPPLEPDNPAISLSRYTEWISGAVGAFFDLNIVPGFSLGGIFMTVVAFSCVVWFLKLVAGG